MTWKKMPLSDLVRFRNGKSIKPGGEGQYPVYGSNGIIGHSTEFLYRDAIVLGRVGAYCGSVAYCPTPFWASDNTIVVEPDVSVFETRYAYYALTHAKLSRCAGGAAQPLITHSVLKGVEIPVPPIEIQHQIAAVLSAYDDLIAVNTRRIAILDEMAENLFDEWFVKFRAPGIDRLRFSQSAIGQSPSDWNISTLGSECLVALGGTPSRKVGRYWSGGVIPWINSSKVNELMVIEPSEFITEEAFRSSSAKMMPAGATLVAITGATLGQVSSLATPMCGNQSVVGIWDRTGDRNEFIYRYVRAHISMLTGKATGGAQQHVNKGDVEELPLLLPPQGLLEKFLSLANPVATLIGSLLRANLGLREAGDLLLPRLISGEIDLAQATRETDITIRRVAAA